MCKDGPDFLQDVIDRLSRALASTPLDTVDRLAALKKVEADVRQQYGHERISIRLGNAARDAAIRRDWANDVPYARLQASYGLSKRAIIYIVKGRQQASAQTR